MSRLDQSPAGKSDNISLRRDTPPNRDNKRSVDFAMDYLKANDPAESKLLEVLEENNVLSSKARQDRGGHRRRASSLQQIVKQLSTRKQLHWDEGEQTGNLETNSSSRANSQTQNDYQSLSNLEENTNGGPTPNPVGRKRRVNSATSAGSQRSLTSSRRSSLPAHTPTSEFLSNLTENLDDVNSFELEEEEEVPPRDMAKTLVGRHRRLRTTTDALYDPHAQYLEALFQLGPKDSFVDIELIQVQNGNKEARPTLPTAVSDLSEQEDENRDEDDVEGGTDINSPLLRRRRQQQAAPQPSCLKRSYIHFLALLSLLGPEDIWHGIVDFVLYRLCLVLVPVLSGSALLFYYFGNPAVHFLPLHAAASWWLIFSSRLLLTFSLAEASQYALEVLTTRTSIIVRIAGPFVALIAMQSVGWPFLVGSWGAWTLLLMRGDHRFVQNWLWFLDIDMFSQKENPDGGVLDCDIYGRILMAMIFVGVATAAKRTVVALYLSRRMLQHYRKHLRELLADMKLVMEVAELAAKTETKEFSELMLEEIAYHQQNSIHGDLSQLRFSVAGDVALTTLKATTSAIVHEKIPTFPTPTKPDDAFARPSNSEDEDDHDLTLSDDEDRASMDVNPATPASRRSHFSIQGGVPKNQSPPPSDRNVKPPVQWNELKKQVYPQRNGEDKVNSSIERRSTAGVVHRTHRSTVSSSRLDKLLPLLERWEEPETKSKKKLPSLFDILQFRKAMEFMENPYPFSSAFGMARTRKECIRSSARVFRRLLRFTPGTSELHFEVIGALAYNDDGDLDETRAQSLLKVFQPDKDDLLSLLSFLQSVDYVYKQLRFLRASILNASKIDSVLDDCFGVIFNGLLTILVMTILGFNPWPLLVSFSTLLVSFAFSFGPSCAKYIEGTLMIAVRRPYDIGDRITIISGESLQQPSSSADTWLVEDISLTTTTLRFAATNEVSTVNNAAIANSRIVNGARSINAIVTVVINFNVRATQEQIEIFRIRVENFLIDRPDIWSGIVHFRNDAVDNNMAYVRYLMRVQHKKSWQDMPPIMVHRGELERFTNNVAIDLGIVWQSPHHRIRVMELPPILQVRDNENSNVEGVHKEEPFMRFLQRDVAGGY